MIILVTNTANTKVEAFSKLRVNMAYKEGKKDNLMYGIFAEKDEHDPSEAFAVYSTKKRAEEVLKDIIKSLANFKSNTQRVAAKKLPNGLVTEYEDKLIPTELMMIAFPKE